MSIRDKFQNALMAGADMAYAIRPRYSPAPDLLRQCRLISHRGEHNGRTIFENTLDAFEKAATAGVWGIEFDIRWTRDLHPVVVHDADLQRVFGLKLRVADVTLDDLRQQCPLVPTLDEVVTQFGQRMHLMVEVKNEPYPQPAHQNEMLAKLFKPLTAGQDYHLLSLSPQMFDLVTFVPKSACFPIAQTQVTAFSRFAGTNGFGGLFGHYLLVNDTLVKQHHRNRQRVGTGYIGSRNCLFRELQRGVDFIFSNSAVRMQKMVDQLLASTDALKP